MIKYLYYYDWKHKEKMSDTLTVYFLRHGFSYANEKGCFGGLTNDSVTPDGVRELQQLKENYNYPPVERVYTSPAMRTRVTAEIFYPGQRPTELPALWEFHFGELEDRYLDDMDPGMRQKWLNGDWDVMIKGGESLREASLRITSGMTHIVSDSIWEGFDRVAVISHGEILYALMKAVLISDSITPKDFLLCPNGMGLVGTINKKTWFDKPVILFQSYLPEGAPRLKPEDSPWFQ